MTLAELQQKTFALLKGGYRPTETDDEYLHRLAGSNNLAIAREVVLWWHAFRIEQSCPITSAFLKQQGLFEAAVARAYREEKLSHFVEETGEAFLTCMAAGEDSVVASLARFEHAFLHVKLGDNAEYAIDWSVDPRHVLGCVVNGELYEPEAHAGEYVVRVGRHLPQMVQVSQG